MTNFFWVANLINLPLAGTQGLAIQLYLLFVMATFFQVQTDAQQIGPTQFVFNLLDVENIHHVVVFLFVYCCC